MSQEEIYFLIPGYVHIFLFIVSWRHDSTTHKHQGEANIPSFFHTFHRWYHMNVYAFVCFFILIHINVGGRAWVMLAGTSRCSKDACILGWICQNTTTGAMTQRVIAIHDISPWTSSTHIIHRLSGETCWEQLPISINAHHTRWIHESFTARQRRDSLLTPCSNKSMRFKEISKIYIATSCHGRTHKCF